MISESLIIAPSSDEETASRQVQNAIEEAGRSEAVAFVYDGILEDEPGVPVHVWEGSKGEAQIRLVMDTVAQVRYFSVSSPDADLRRRLLAEAAKHLASVTVEELRRDVRERGSADSNAYLRLSIGLNGKYDPESRDLIRAGLESTEPSVRGSAAEAAAMLGWPELSDSILSALLREADEGVARVLALAAQRSSEGRS